MLEPSQVRRPGLPELSNLVSPPAEAGGLPGSELVFVSKFLFQSKSWLCGWDLDLDFDLDVDLVNLIRSMLLNV